MTHNYRPMSRSLLTLSQSERRTRRISDTQRSHITGQVVSVVVVNANDAYETGWHEHSEFMVLVAMCGGLALRTEPERTAFRLMPGNLAMVRPTIFHATTALRATQQHYAVYIDPEYVRHVLRNVGVANAPPGWERAAVWGASNALASMLRLHDELYKVRNITDQSLQQDAMSRLLATECIAQTLYAPKPVLSPITRDRLLMMDIQSFIDAHLAEGLTIDELAQRFLISRRHLTRLFKRHNGYSVLEFMNLCRVERARQLLTDPRITVLDAALTVGLESPSYLTKLIRKYTGKASHQN